MTAYLNTFSVDVFDGGVVGDPNEELSVARSVVFLLLVLNLKLQAAD